LWYNTVDSIQAKKGWFAAMSEQSVTTYRGQPRVNKRETARRKMIEQVLNEVRVRLEHVSQSHLEQALTRWKQALPDQNSPVLQQHSEQEELVTALSEGQSYTQDEALRLEIEAQERAFIRRRELLKGALTAPQVARLLGTTRQTPHDRAQSRTLLAVEDRGSLYFPYWQFDADGPNGVISGLPAVLRALDISPLGKVSWLTLPNPYLEGRTPLASLKAGEWERVVDQAQAVGAGI
jgi:hypothetical protein